jgi:glutathione S-transferase
MSLTLYYHPLSSFCMKALVGLYELGVAHEKRLVDLSDPSQRAALFKLSPIGKFPVLRDEANDRTVPESSIILEHLDLHYGRGRLVPLDADRAITCRLRDRFFDAYIHLPMQRIVGDRLRVDGTRDPFGVQQEKERIAASYAIADADLRADGWAVGGDFTMADCAAAPALFYAQKIVPFGDRPRLAAYYERLTRRASFARVLDEAAPYFAMFPQG